MMKLEAMVRSKSDIVISYHQVERVVDDKGNSSGKGEYGDGMTFVPFVKQPFNIATLEKGEKLVI